MENLDTNELIEQYLNGSLSPAEQQVIETRMADNADFRSEVALHRQLHQELADPRKLQLRDLLSDVVQNPIPTPPTANNNWLKWLGIIMAILMLLWLGWLWLSLPHGINPMPPVHQEIKPPVPSITPVDSPETHLKPAEKAPEPIAMADPAAFATNRDFEARLGSTIRATDGSAEMQSPTLSANFKPQNGLVKINFRGTAPAAADTAQYPLVLKIYGNKSAASKPLFQLLPSIVQPSNGIGRWTFSTSQQLRLRPGLYYFTVERQADEDLIFVGKFTVGAR